MRSDSKVNQALIMAGGIGSRLGLGTKSHILYRGKILLEYVVESCLQAGIENLVVNLVPEDVEKNILNEKLERLKILQTKYPKIKFVHGSSLKLRFGEVPNELRSYLDEKKPFYILCGQSPQSSLFLKQLAGLYKPNSVICSGYKTRHDYMVSIGKTNGNEIKKFSNIEEDKPRKFKAGRNEIINQSPYVIDFTFYDKYLLADNFKDRIEFYLDKLLKDGGKVYFVMNPISLSELDYREELPELYRSILFLTKK